MFCHTLGAGGEDWLSAEENGRGLATAAFLMRAPRMSEVRAVCMSGQLMPEKSTYFYPKLLAGLVINPLS